MHAEKRGCLCEALRLCGYYINYSVNSTIPLSLCWPVSTSDWYLEALTMLCLTLLYDKFICLSLPQRESRGLSLERLYVQFYVKEALKLAAASASGRKLSWRRTKKWKLKVYTIRRESYNTASSQYSAHAGETTAAESWPSTWNAEKPVWLCVKLIATGLWSSISARLSQRREATRRPRREEGVFCLAD